MDDEQAGRAAEGEGTEARFEPQSAAQRALSPAAERALAEAAARREEFLAREAAMPREIGGRRKGREPARYGDWERKGLAVDF